MPVVIDASVIFSVLNFPQGLEIRLFAACNAAFTQIKDMLGNTSMLTK